MSTARVVYAGTTEFAATILSALLAQRRPEVVAVYTQPDRPAGRGRKPQSSAVKRLAESRSIPTIQPVTLRAPSAVAQLQALRPDLLIVAAYGLLLPQAVLDVPRHGCLNVHASLLPRWRGAAPIQRALLSGDRETGVTIMRMVAELDAGPILSRHSCVIEPMATAGSLEQRLATLGADALLEIMDRVLDDRATATEQDPAQVCYAQKIDKADRILNWSEPATALERRVRALLPRPAATVTFDGETCKILGALVCSGQGTPGQILAVGTEGIDIATGAGALRLTRLHPPGKREMSATEFARGRALPVAVG